MKKPLKEVITDGMKTHIHKDDPRRTSVDAPTQKHTPEEPVEHDHDAIWFAELLEMRMKDLRGKERTIHAKFSLGSAQALAKQLREDYAAAPDLLEAAKKVMMFIESLPYHGMDISTDIQESLRRAIAKAEGK